MSLLGSVFNVLGHLVTPDGDTSQAHSASEATEMKKDIINKVVTGADVLLDAVDLPLLSEEENELLDDAVCVLMELGLRVGFRKAKEALGLDDTAVDMLSAPPETGVQD